jgi:hypothetical protein
VVVAVVVTHVKKYNPVRVLYARGVDYGNIVSAWAVVHPCAEYTPTWAACFFHLRDSESTPNVGARQDERRTNVILSIDIEQPLWM